jgi:DNA-binding LytR/AlgR family response regulator
MIATLSCIVIDDEKLYLNLLEQYVAQTPFLKLIHSFDNAIDAIPIMDQHRVDLIITDVRMPQLTGIQFARILNNKSMVILVSSFKEHAVTGFEINAIDYLLKPFAYDRFLQAVAKAQAQNTLMGLKNESENLAGRLPVTQQDALFVKASGKIVKIKLEDILFIEARKEYVSIVTIHDEKILTLYGLGAMEDILSLCGFLRIHKSFLIPMDKIEEIYQNTVKIGKHTIPISITHKQSLLNSIQKKAFI